MDDIQALRALQELAFATAKAGALGPLLDRICGLAITLSEADFGNVQLIDPATSDLHIVAQHGFPNWWVEFWDAAAKGEGVCGSAVEARERIIVPDVAASPLFVGKPALAMQLRAGVRAVQSTPLVTRDGRAVGVLSTHFRVPHRPGERVLQWLDLLARQSADLIDTTQIAAALRLSESRFRALVTASSDVIFRLSADGSRIHFLDKRGAVPESDPGADWLAEYIRPEDRPEALAAFSAAAHTKTPMNIEHRVQRPDGGIGWMHTHAVPLLGPAGEIVEWFGASSDVTDARRANAELFEERQRLEALLHALPVGVAFATSRDAETVRGNAKLLEQFGAQRDDNVSASARADDARGRQLVFLHEGRQVPPGELPLQTAAREGRPVDPTELLVVLPTGKEVNIEVSAVPIRNSAQEVVGAVAVTMDIDERKRAAEVREQMRLKDEFLGILGHELRNPLAAISSTLRLLQLTGATEGRHPLNDLIGSQVDVLRRLVDDLLDLSRTSLGTLRLDRGSVSLAGLLKTAAAAAQPAVESREQHLRVTSAAQDVSFSADRVRLQQVLANLLDNASKYAPRGGHIELSGELQGADVVLRCKDDGPGIPPELQESVFEPLVRAEAARSAAPQGLGLGLALVRRLAELHGGSACVKSDGEGSGSEFIVRVPYVPAPEPQVQPVEDDPPPTAPKRLRTLLVDDHPALVAATAELLRSESCDVVSASTARAAIDAARQMRPELLLCDLALPDMQGLELIGELREELEAWGTYVVIVTARSEQELVPYGKKARELGVAQFVSKPITAEWLRKVVARASGAKR